MLQAKDNSTAMLTGCLDCMLLVFLNNKPYLFRCNDKSCKKDTISMVRQKLEKRDASWSNPVSVQPVESSYGPIRIAYTTSVAVRAGVKYVSIVLFLSDVLSARKLGISYLRTEGCSCLCSYQFCNYGQCSAPSISRPRLPWRNQVRANRTRQYNHIVSWMVPIVRPLLPRLDDITHPSPTPPTCWSSPAGR